MSMGRNQSVGGPVLGVGVFVSIVGVITYMAVYLIGPKSPISDMATTTSAQMQVFALTVLLPVGVIVGLLLWLYIESL